MKKLGIVALIVGLLIFSISTGAWAQSVQNTTPAPTLTVPMLIELHGAFSKSYTAKLTDYQNGVLQDLQVGWIIVGGPKDLRIDAKLDSIGGAVSTAARRNAAEAFEIAENGFGWKDFSYAGYAGQVVQLHDVVGEIYYHTDWIMYKWNLKELGTANAGKSLKYNLTFIVTSH